MKFKSCHPTKFSCCLGVLILLFGGLGAALATIQTNLQMQLGNPSNATNDPNNHTHYLIQRSVEALDYNDSLGIPNWASWDLTAADVGSSGRSSDFYTDTNLPAGFYEVTTGNYSGSGYDRGHMCPSGDRTDSDADNALVFFLSNIIPQAADNNQGVWESFESYCRSLATGNGSELLITCGPSGFNGTWIPSGKAAVPQYVWKIAVVVPPGSGTALSRITAATRVIAIKTPNLTNGTLSRTIPWTNFLTTARQIEVDTGFTFFTALPGPIASALRYRIDGLTNPPPQITSFTPDSGPTLAGVVITGTNFTSALGVSFNGVSASFDVNSSTQITAYVPTNATSGNITVTTPGGAAISAGSFGVSGNAAADLAVQSTHSTSFTQGDTGRTYILLVTNVGSAAATGTVTLTDTLPNGLVATALGGSGWTADLATLTATRSDSLAPGDAYPPLTLTVNVTAPISGYLTNQVSVSASSDVNPANNTASDPTFIAANPATAAVVISQIYGGGGNSGAVLQNDYVELFNRSTNAVDISSWSLQYAAATTASWQTANLSGVLQPYRYYLVQLASGGAAGAALPVADATNSINLNASSGKLALVSSQAALTITNPAGTLGVVDCVGYGSANGFEGSGPASSPSATTAVFRADNGMADTGDNAADFLTAAPNPRNSSVMNGSLPPTVTTGSASGVDSATATLSGTVSPNNQPTTNWFEYGSSANYGFTAPVPGTISGPNVQAVSATLSGLAAGATYHFRLDSSNSLGASYGQDQTFTTLSPTLAILAGWDVSGQSNFGVSPLPPVTNAAGLTIAGLTRSSGIQTNASATAHAWGGVNFVNSSTDSALSSNRFITFGFTANAGSKVSCASLSQFTYRRSSTGPTAGVLQYQIGTGGFTDITNFSYSASGANTSLAPVDLSGISALQNVEAGVAVTFRLINYNASGTGGTWYIATNSGSADALELQGIVSPAAPDLAISLSHSANFTQGDTSDTYTLLVTNAGSGASSGAVSVSDLLPAGLTATSLSGSGWTPDLASLTCSRSDALAPNAAYPPITLTVRVATNAPLSVTNVAQVSGGSDGNLANNSASDATAVVALTPIQLWRLSWFGTTANLGAAADLAIGASDGMPNLLKYALGLSPLAEAANPVIGDITTGHLRLTLPKNPAATDVGFYVETSDDLNAPAWTTNGTTIEQNTPTLLRVQDNTPVSSATERFMRLRVTRTSP